MERRRERKGNENPSPLPFSLKEIVAVVLVTVKGVSMQAIVTANKCSWCFGCNRWGAATSSMPLLRLKGQKKYM